MDLKRTSRFRTAFVGGITVSALIALCLSYLLHPAIRARYLFGQLETLQLGHSTFEDASAATATTADGEISLHA
jgi:hypothetical protein